MTAIENTGFMDFYNWWFNETIPPTNYRIATKLNEIKSRLAAEEKEKPSAPASLSDKDIPCGIRLEIMDVVGGNKSTGKAVDNIMAMFPHYQPTTASASLIDEINNLAYELMRENKDNVYLGQALQKMTSRYQPTNMSDKGDK